MDISKPKETLMTITKSRVEKSGFIVTVYEYNHRASGIESNAFYEVELRKKFKQKNH
jgi:hypothetical protein